MVDRSDSISGFVTIGRTRWSSPFSVVMVVARTQPDGATTVGPAGLRVTRTNIWGGFEFTGLTDGRYHLVAIGPAGLASDQIQVGSRDARLGLTFSSADDP